MTEVIEIYHLLKETGSLSQRSFNKHDFNQVERRFVGAMNKVKITLGVMAYYSKAFDTVGHQILITKLRCLKYSRKALKITVYS